jgi:hypothetical protein
MNKYKYIITEPFSKTMHFLCPLVRYYTPYYYPVEAYVYNNLWPNHHIDNGHIVVKYKIDIPKPANNPYDKETQTQIVDYRIIGRYIYFLCSLEKWKPEVALFLKGNYSAFSDEAKALISKCFGGKPDKPLTIESAPNKKVIALVSPYLIADEVNIELEDYIGATLDECKEVAGILNVELETLVLENI